MSKYITEVLTEINKDPELLKSTYKPVNGGGLLGLMFKYAFMSEFKFLLPETDPPFKPDPAPMGMSPSRFQNEIKRLYVFCDGNLTKNRRELIFIQMLESVHPEEAKILIAIKDQQLPKLYPNITRKVLEEAGFLPVEEAIIDTSHDAKVEPKVEVKKTNKSVARKR